MGSDETAEGGGQPTMPDARARRRHVLHVSRRHLRNSALKLGGFLIGAYLVLRLIPSLSRALESLERVSWQWVLVALALETASETGFAVSWSAIVDPDEMLAAEGGNRRMEQRVAWAQLGAGTLVPGGSFGGLGVGAWLLHRFGMPGGLIAERQFSLSFLNTFADAAALILFGVALGVGLLPGTHKVTLTLVPAIAAGAGVVIVLLIAHRFTPSAERRARHPRLASAVATLAQAVDDTERIVISRGNHKPLLGAIAYLGFDVLVLWSAFSAIHAHPVPSFALVLMAYIIGALGGSLPLPAGLGTIGGMVGMLILYGVSHEAALASVLLFQAIGMLVPLIGGAIGYLLVRRAFGAIGAHETEAGAEV